MLFCIYKTSVGKNPGIMKLKSFLFLIAIMILSLQVNGQIEFTKEQIEESITNSPAFSIYKDNYFLTGVPLNHRITKFNADAKFQVSFKQRIKDKPVFWGSYLYITYTQKSFWGIYQESKPFEETNYNPGLALAKPIYKNNNFLGALWFTIEHESNGRDGDNSRSWNFVSAGYIHWFSEEFSLSLKLWYPFWYKDDNPDLMDYIGYGEATLLWNFNKDKLYLKIKGKKGADLHRHGSIVTEFSWRPFQERNIYLTAQWWLGYSESLIEYEKGVNMFRIGISLKPEFLRIY